MKELLCALYFTILMALVSGCTPAPQKSTEQFLTDLRNGRYIDAKTIAAPQVKKQIAIIERDKYALYNGQKWNYGNVTAQITDKAALVLYTVKLNDGTEIKQQARLIQSNKRWLVHAIENIKIVYSSTALQERVYPDHGNQMLVAPLDIEDITTSKLTQHMGQYVMVSGNLCAFEEKDNTTVMTMGDDDFKPLLYVTLTGNAKARALKDHKQYMQIDSMVESPMGNTFTAIGLLNRVQERFLMDVDNSQNIVIGRVVRAEKP